MIDEPNFHRVIRPEWPAIQQCYATITTDYSKLPSLVFRQARQADTPGINQLTRMDSKSIANACCECLFRLAGLQHVYMVVLVVLYDIRAWRGGVS